MTHSASRAINGFLETLNRYVAFVLLSLLATGLYAQSCPSPGTSTGNIQLNTDCSSPTISTILSGDILNIDLIDCSRYTFEVCYNATYALPDIDQVQIQLFDSSFIQEDNSPEKGCATITYLSGVNDAVTLQAFSHSCLADWKQWDLKITKACCTIEASENISITANQADCTAPSFEIDLPVVSIGCNTSMVSFNISPAITNLPASSSPVALIDGTLYIPAGTKIGTYTITWSVADCNGVTIATTQLIDISPVVACDNQVNLTIPNGTLTVTTNMVSEAIPESCTDDYEVSIIDGGLSLGNQISCQFSGQIIEYRLVHISTGLACEGSILIEDKTGPTLACIDMNIPCSADSSPAELGAPFVTDNCDDNPSLLSSDNLIDYECENPNFLSTIERTWIATDNLGNSSSCIQVINIIRPSLTGLTFPDDITIDCTDGDIAPSNTGGPSIAEMISGNACNFIVDFEDSATPVCTGTTKIIRRWTVIDWCTDTRQSDTQIIVVKDTLGPDIDCPTSFTFGTDESNCAATINFPTLESSDDCSTILSVTPKWEFGSGAGPYTVPIGEYIVTFIAEDDCGNTSICEVPVTVIDDVIPVAICDLFTTVGIGESQTSMICAEDVDSGSTDNCDLVDREIRLVGDSLYSDCISLSCEQTGQVLMLEMQVTDHNGLQNQCMVEVTVFDKLPPIITNCAVDVTINCDDDPNDITLTGTPTAEDNCAVVINFTDVRNVNECNIGEIIRTFIVSDNSQNQTTCTQTITLEDNTAPIITFTPDITLFCQSVDDEIGKPTVEDNCGVFAFLPTDEILENGPCVQRLRRSWEVLNICTDELVIGIVNITLLNDLDAPLFSDAPTDITADCNAEIPLFIDPTISDACDNELSIEINTIDQAGECPAIRTITKTTTATDDCGNVSTFIQTISLIDISGPVFTDFPANQTISCEAEPTLALPIVIDDCDDIPNLSVVLDTFPGDCSNEQLVFRTFTATDRCGNTSTATQIFNYIDNTAPIIRGQTDDLTISCEFPIPAFDLGALDNCDTQLTIDLVDTSVPGDCPNSEFVTRVYSVTDDCGNVKLDTIEITIIDNIPPRLTATNLVENITIACNQAFPDIDFTIIDNCDNDIMIVETRDTTGNPCNYQVVRTFTATDDCGNATARTQNLNITDDQAPIFSVFPQNQDVTIFSGEQVQVDVIDAEIIDNCSSENEVRFVIDLFSDGDQPDAPSVESVGNNASGIYPLGRHTITFTTVDNCGNDLVRDLIISVFDFSPSGLCNSVTLEIGENGQLAVQPRSILDDPSIANDPSLMIRFVNPSNFTQVIGDELIFDCDDLGVIQYAIEIIIADGTSSICSNMIRLVDTDMTCGPDTGKATLAGMVYSTSGEPMKEVQMELINDDNLLTMTDQFGIFAFPDLSMGSTHILQPIYDKNPALGVTTFDMVLIQQHILSVKLFSNPFQHIAADVDLNGKIDIFDLLEIRSLILYQTERFSKSPSYRFIAANYQFEQPQNPLSETIPASHHCANIEGSQTDLNFVCIKMGDVSGTNPSSANTSLEKRNIADYKLIYEDQYLVAGLETRVDIYGMSTEHIVGLQFALTTNKGKLNYSRTPKNLVGNIHHDNNTTHFAWTQYDNDITDELFSIYITIDEPTKLSEVLIIDNSKPALFYNKQGFFGNISLQKSNLLDEYSVNILEQNQPNPFTENTLIPFYLSTAGEASISIQNIKGKVIYTHYATYQKGWHQHEILASDLAAGIYFYELRHGLNTQIKKMIIAR